MPDRIFLLAAIFNLLAHHSAFTFPTSQEAELRVLEDFYNSDEYILHMKKIQQNAVNNTNADLDILLSNGNFKSLGTLKCSVCKLTLKYALWKFRKPDGTYDGLPEFANSVCKRLHIETDKVCDGIVTTYKQEILTLLKELKLSAEQVCGLILPTTCYAPDLAWNLKWNITIPGELPRRLFPAKSSRKSQETPKLRILHLSDIHMDLNYTPGALVDCKEPLCCRNTDKMKAGSRTAGYWGSLGYCDTPYWTLQNLLQHASKNDYDYIIWTGDLPAHNDWGQNREQQIEVLYNLTSLFLKYFPNTPIYPSLGNHESFPVNNFPPEYVHDNNSISWLYTALRKAWSPWLPAEALQTVQQSGYYTTLVRPNFRIVSLNMNYCNQQNWWMLINPVDPNHELAWLVQVLTEAEELGEKVHILGHIPPGCSDCLSVWSRNYYEIVNRFSSTIVAQFFGHTHSDEMEIFYDEKTKKIATNVAYIAPSVTTFYNLHPGYREYIMDGFYHSSTWEILDHSTYILNLTKANNLQPGQEATWELLYTAKNAYGMPDLSSKSWNALVNSWINAKDAKTESLFQKYYYYFYKGNPPDPICNSACKKTMLCALRSARSGDNTDFCSGL